MAGSDLNVLRKFIYPFLAKDADARVLQIAGIGRFVLIFIQGIVLVKAGVPLEIIGQVEFVFFVANFLVFYLQNGGRNALLSWAPKSSKTIDVRIRLCSVYGALHIFGLIALGLLAVLSQVPYADKYQWLSTGSAPLLLGVYMLFTVPVTALIYNYLLTGRRERILWFVVISYCCQICAVLIPILLGWGIDAMLVTLAVFAVLRWLFATFDGQWFAAGRPSWTLVMAFIGFSLPLVVHALNSGLMDYVDGWIVSGFFGDDQFALYRYGAKEFPVNALLIGGLLTGMIPRFRKAGEIDTSALKHEIWRLMRILVPANCLLILLSPLLYELVYSDVFIVSARIFNVYALTLLSRIVMNQVFLYVFHHNWVLAVSTMAEVVVNVILSVLLMRQLGLIGIPIATVISYGLHKVFMILYIRFYFNVHMNAYIPVRAFIASFLAMGLCVYVAELIYF